MQTFTATADQNNIILTLGNNVRKNILINTLYLNNGNRATDKSSLIIDQQKVNYLDSIKDGTNVQAMQNLNIYPLAEQGFYPTFPSDLKGYEQNILIARSSYLEHTAWLKVKKGSVLDQGKNYSNCLWESGLGYNVFLKDPNNVTTIKTFGSYIDPLEKQSAKEVWPPINSTVTLTKEFMQIMGFGENSYVTAKTKTNSTFIYNMNIGCGSNCLTADACTLTWNGNGIDPNLAYFAGNNLKKQLLKSSAGAQEKIKTIVVKEWGDKIQVLIYLLLYYLYKNRYTTVIMTTCDMVVFMLCLNLSIPCIYTGVYRPPGSNLDPNKKYYSVLEFKPSDTPFADARTRLYAKLDSIIAENQSFITALTKLATPEGANTRISVGNNMLTFSQNFYSLILQDLNDIQSKLLSDKNRLIARYNSLTEQTGNISDIETTIKEIQSKYIIVPFLKQKKGMNNTANILTILMTKSYTAQKPTDNSKPHIEAYLVQSMGSLNAEKESKKSFYDIASSAKNGFLVSKRGGQRGGTLEEEQIISLFPEDDDTDDVEKYTYITNGEIENENISYDDSQGDYPVFNQNINENTERKNLLIDLKVTFSAAIKALNISNTNIKYRTDNFVETVYTLFVYESYLNGYGASEFDSNDLSRIIEGYGLMVDDVEVDRQLIVQQPLMQKSNIITTANTIQPIQRQSMKRGREYDETSFKKARPTSYYEAVEGVDYSQYQNQFPFFGQTSFHPGIRQTGVVYGGKTTLKRRRVMKRKTLSRRKNKKTIKKQIKQRNTQKYRGK